jgi:MFS family permease
MKESAYRKYLLAVLLTISAFNSMDGLALGLVLQSIKVDLSLSDTKLGFLTGIAFAVFYSIMGIPLARWADRGNRITIIALTTALWSLALVLCGLVKSFVQLLWVRVVVAVGEAGCMPIASSLIADHFSRAERPRAMSRFMLAAPLSCVLGYFVAGWLNEAYGWRVTFMLLGLPGLVLAALARLSLKEPRSWESESDAVRTSAGRSTPGPGVLEDAHPALREVCRTLWNNGTFRQLLLSFAVMTFCGNGTTQWLSTFLIREYGLRTGELGTWFAVIYGTGGAVGTFLGGELAFRFAANNERLQLKAMAWVYVASGMAATFVYISPTQYLSFVLIWMNSVTAAMSMGPLFAVIQALVPEGVRAQAIALLFLFSNLIGMGLGPLAVGALSDAFHPWVGEQSLRYALLTLCPTYLWIAWHLRRAHQTVARDIEAVQANAESSGDSSMASNGSMHTAIPLNRK